ncbi:MAG: DUF4252 domain-containing protein [Proteobacteria bacterium]|nr:DUF4252 domain-containing protein [Pseudomonadota bacterium]
MKKIILLLSFLLLSGVHAAETLGDLDKVMGGKPNVRISVGPELLAIAGQFSDQVKGIGDVFNDLQDISIRVYELSSADNHDKITDWLATSVKRLAKSGVTEIVRVVEDDEIVYILAKVDTDRISDVAIMVYEQGEEFVYVKLNGSLQVKNLKALINKFDLDALEKLSFNL